MRVVLNQPRQRVECSRWGYRVYQLFKAECGGTCTSGSQAGPSTGIKGGRETTMAHYTSTDRNQFHGLHVSSINIRILSLHK